MAKITLPTGFVFDFSGLYGENYVTSEEVEAFKPEWEKGHEAVCEMRRTGKAAGHLSKDGGQERVRFFQLPFIGEDKINTPERIRFIEAYAQSLRQRVDAVIFYGVGGSYLGGKVLFDVHCGAVWNLLTSEERSGYPRIFFAGNNADGRSLCDLKAFFMREKKRKSDYTVVHIVISKSGTTIEPMAGYVTMEGALRKLGICTETAVITSPTEGDGETLLHKTARQMKWPMFYVPDGIGGRFSVFSETALLAGAIIGFPIREFLAGAAAMDEACRTSDIMKNPALLNAVLKYLAAVHHDRTIEVFMPYADALKSLSEWYVQLSAESLGKRRNRHGQNVFYGRTPVASVGTTDMHAQTQEHQDGPHDKIVQFVVLKKWQKDAVIPERYAETAGLEELGGLALSDIMTAACAANATALGEDDRPHAVFELPELSAFHLGELMYMLCLSVAYEGELADVDAFDQPGVEIYKRHLRNTLKNLKKR